MIPKAVMESTEDGGTIRCSGEWTVAGTKALPPSFASFLVQSANSVNVDGGEITELDTVGAFYLRRLIEEFEKAGKKITLTHLAKQHASIFQLVEKKIDKLELVEPEVEEQNILEMLGRVAVQKWEIAVQFFTFFGEIVVQFWKMRAHGAQNLWKSALRVIQTMGCEALPIVALMSFLVGIVLSYQLGVQLKMYGADIYVVDATGIAILREFAPLMTAVIIAGRTSTAFAAFIGSMKVNNELDALATMGISPIERIVLPRVVGLLIALPLLVLWSSFFSVFGSMVMAKSQSHIGYLSFLDRFRAAVALKEYVLGMIKTPFFAVIIAVVGCFQGFQTTLTADSVGLKTTAAAVQSIFLIIIADAFFSVLYSWRGL